MARMGTLATGLAGGMLAEGARQWAQGKRPSARASCDSSARSSPFVLAEVTCDAPYGVPPLRVAGSSGCVKGSPASTIP